jgi:CheY-like chemotaxis protein
MQSLPLGERVIEVDLRAAAHLVDHATRQAVLIWEKVMPTPVGFSTSPPYLRNRSAKRSAATETPPLSPSGSRNVFSDCMPVPGEGEGVATEAQPAKQAKLLVVEDDVMIRMLLADMLCEIGYTVAAEAASVDEALEATRKTDFDLAILDADLQGRSVSPVVDALVARDIGFVFVTGYGDHGLLAYRNRPTLNKPFQIDALKRCCKSALRPGSH